MSSDDNLSLCLQQIRNELFNKISNNDKVNNDDDDEKTGYVSKIHSEIFNIEMKMEQCLNHLTDDNGDNEIISDGSNKFCNEFILKLLLYDRAIVLAYMFNEIKHQYDCYRNNLNQLKNFKTLTIDNLLEIVKNFTENHWKMIEYYEIFEKIQNSSSKSKFLILFEKFLDNKQRKSEKIDLMIEVFRFTLQKLLWPKILHSTLPAINVDKNQLNNNDEIENFSKYISLFEICFKFLLEIIIKSYKQGKHFNVFKSPKINPLHIMFEAFSKRFDFHFMDQNQSEIASNPEWYFYSLELWISLNKDFLEKYVDPILEQYFKNNDNDENIVFSVVELIRFFNSLIEKKLVQLINYIRIDNINEDIIMDSGDHTDMNQSILKDKQNDFIEKFTILFKTINNLFVYRKQLDLFIPYFSNENNDDVSSESKNLLSIIFSDRYLFQKFLDNERNLNNERIDSIIKKQPAIWESIDDIQDNSDGLNDQDNGDENSYIISKAAFEFSLIVENRVERLKMIPDEYQKMYSKIVIELFDDFCLRLTQTYHNLDKFESNEFFSILNTFDYILAMIEKLQQQEQHQLHSQSSSSSLVNIDFNNVISKLNHMIDTMTNRLSDKISNEFSQKFSIILSYNINNSMDKLMNRNIWCNLLECKILSIYKQISNRLKRIFLHKLALKIQDVFFNNYIMKTIFNDYNYLQMKYDFKKLSSIFQTFTNNHDFVHEFTIVNECICLLGLQLETLETIRDCYNKNKLKNQNIHLSDLRLLLNSLNIYCLQPSIVMDLIERRIMFMG